MTCWPYESNQMTVEQMIRMDDFRADIQRAWDAHRDGFSYHMWIDGRYYDSALTHSDAFEQCKSLRQTGDYCEFLVGYGSSYQTTVSVNGRMLQIDLDAP